MSRAFVRNSLFLKGQLHVFRQPQTSVAARSVERPNHAAREMSSFSKQKQHHHSTEKGIEGRRKSKKKKDPDSQFMELWKNTETHLRDRLRATVRGTKVPKRRQRDMNITSLPGESEITREREFQLLDDDDKIAYRVPKIDEFVGNITETAMKQSDKEVETLASEPTFVEGGMSFADMGVHPKLIAKLKNYGITKPVPVQERALPIIYKNKSILIKSETGSGKTLVFLLPTVQDPGKGYGTVIIVPTRELASQMLYEVHRLLGDKSIVASFVSGVDLSSQEKRLHDADHPPRIIIGTPKRLWEVVQANESLFHKTKRIVIDEVDKTLLPLHERASQKKMMSRLIHPRPGRLVVEKLMKVSKITQMQLIGATATVNDVLKEDLVDLGWGDHVTIVQPPSYESKRRNIPECIKHRYTVYDHLIQASKAHALARVYGDSAQKSALVFIHRLHSVDDFVWELRYLGLNAAALYKQVATQDPSKHQKFLSDFRSGKIQLLVGTEETVRGLDFKELDHVYLMEVPKNVDEYLHLAGRVGRQNRPGTTTTIVSKGGVGEERRLLLQYRRLSIPFEQI